MALSFADASTLHGKAIKILNVIDLFYNSNTPNLDTVCDAVEAANIGDNQPAITSAVAALRSGAASIVDEAFVRAFMLPSLQEWNAAIGAPEGIRADFDTCMLRLRDYFVANTKSINSRAPTYGAMATFTGTGSGTIYRLTVDDEGFNLEGNTSEVKTLECRLDQSNVEKHHEVFEVRGATRFRDMLSYTGTGIVGSLQCLTTRDSARYIVNPSFSQYGGTTQPSAGSEQTITATTSITGWTADATTGVKISLGPSDAAFRDLIGESNKYCVKFEDNSTITQQLNSYQNPLFTQQTPYIFRVAIYRNSSCDGTLTITLGATTRAVTMSTLSDNAWNAVTLTMDKGLYPRNFRANDITIAFALASRTTGSLYLDDIVFAPMTLIDGVYYAAVGGATPFLRGAYTTFTDTEGTRATRAYWFMRAGVGRRAPGFTLPTNNSAAETEADPA